MRTLNSLIAAIFVLTSSGVMAATCLTKVVNDTGFYWSPIQVADGGCTNATGKSITCPSKIDQEGTTYFKPNKRNWSTVLTVSNHASPSVNTGSFRIEIQNANSRDPNKACTPKILYSDYCSTDPSKGKQDCKYVWNQSTGSVTIEKIKE